MVDGDWLSRRRFLVLGGAVAGGSLLVIWLREALSTGPGTSGSQGNRSNVATTAGSPGSTTAPADGLQKWSDAATWADGVPTPGSVVSVDKPIVLDIDAQVAGLTITATGSVTFDPATSRTLVSSGNVVVRGRLVLKPAAADLTHTITFAGVDERIFAGDGMEPLDTDVGLWIMDNGTVDLAGTPKLAWTRAGSALTAGTTEIELQDEPAGWRSGDELVITPTGLSRGETSGDGFETAAVESVSGRTVRLHRALRRDHPTVDAGGMRTMTAEVLNVTRNVRIEGSPKGRAHIMVHSARPQSIRQAALRYLGPRQPGDEFTQGVLGRYALHFHLCEDGSRGSVVEATVVRDAGNHAFVPHTSHGVTFRDCISFDTYDEPYWWDQAPNTRTAGPPTDDTAYVNCVAALVRVDPPFRGYRLSGFVLGRGRGNVARGCVAVGVQGSGDASGFHWPEGSQGVWTFADCVAHNNVNGIFTWQNTSDVHTIADFVAYHNHESGISHGAYGNPYLYRDVILHGNAAGAVRVHAVSRDDGLRFVNLICDGAGQSDYLVVAAKHVFDGAVPSRFTGCRFTGARKAAFGLTYEGADGAGAADLMEITGCTFTGNEFWLADDINPGTELRVRDRTHGSLLVRRSDQPGELNVAWNGRVTAVSGPT